MAEKVEIVQFETAQLYKAKDFPKIHSLINWTNHVEILSSCKLTEERLFYILYANKEQFDGKELKRAIKTNASAHIINKESNQSKGMQRVYPNSNYLFKDVAYLDFLGLPQKHSENREIVKYALNRSLSPTMIAKYERELIPKEVLQKSLNEFFSFIKE